MACRLPKVFLLESPWLLGLEPGNFLRTVYTLYLLKVSSFKPCWLARTMAGGGTRRAGRALGVVLCLSGPLPSLNQHHLQVSAFPVCLGVVPKTLPILCLDLQGVCSCRSCWVLPVLSLHPVVFQNSCDTWPFTEVLAVCPALAL